MQNIFCSSSAASPALLCFTLGPAGCFHLLLARLCGRHHQLSWFEGSLHAACPDAKIARYGSIPSYMSLFPDNLSLSLWQQMEHQAVSCPHPNRSSLQSLHLPVQEASVSTRYYVSYTSLDPLFACFTWMVPVPLYLLLLCFGAILWVVTWRHLRKGQATQDTHKVLPPSDLSLATNLCLGSSPV